MFQVLVSPGRVGSNDFVLQLMAGDGTPLKANHATLSLSMPERGLAPLEWSATPGEDSYWHVAGVPLTVAGRWHIRIEAETVFQRLTLEDDFDVPAQ